MESKAKVAARIGMRDDEVIDVLDSPAGLVITTFDGHSYIDVPTDKPDAEGKTGLMFLAAPKVDYGKGDTSAFPVFAQPEEEHAEPVESDGVPTGSADAVLAWVAGDEARAREALDAEQASKKPRKGLVAELEQILDQWKAPESDGDGGGTNGDGKAD